MPTGFRFALVARVLGCGLVSLAVAIPSAAYAAPATAGWRGALAVRACAAEPLVLPEQTEAALDATLLVRVGEGIGSAVLVSPDGFALTAAHVLGDAEAVTVVGNNGASLRAEVVRVDEHQDVALLKLQALGDTPCLAPVADKASIGSDVFVLGSPGGEELSFSVAKGIVSGYRELGGLRFVQLDASVNPGNSGGPAVDESARIIGIASWKVSHVSMEGLAFAVPIDVAFSSLDVTLGDASATDWRERGGRRAAASTVAPTSVAAPAKSRSPDELQRIAALQRRVAIRTGLIASGASLLGVGVISVAATGGAYYGDVRMSKAEWTTAVAFNTIGWICAGVGAALLGSGLIVRKKPRAKKVAFLAWPGGIGGSF